MTNQKQTNPLKILTFRYEGESRIYSNYVEVVRNQSEVSIKFCDVRPPTNQEELIEAEETGIIDAPIEAEIVLPVDVAKEFMKALQVQLQGDISKKN